jgi:hypothetical protein
VYRAENVEFLKFNHLPIYTHLGVGLLKLTSGEQRLTTLYLEANLIRLLRLSRDRIYSSHYFPCTTVMLGAYYVFIPKKVEVT